MPALKPGTETREVEFADQIDGGLKNIRFCYKEKGEGGYWGGNPWNPLETDIKPILGNVRIAWRKKKAYEDQINLFESYTKKRENQAGLRLLFYLTKSQRRTEKYLDLWGKVYDPRTFVSSDLS